MTHSTSVTKIKKEIYDDRVNFLQKLLQMQNENSIDATQDV